MVIARVILKEARSYRQGGRRFIKDVPQTIKGEEVTQYQNNGYFSVTILKGKVEEPAPSSKAKVEPLDDDDDLDEAPSKKSGSGLKKRT